MTARRTPRHPVPTSKASRVGPGLFAAVAVVVVLGGLVLLVVASRDKGPDVPAGPPPGVEVFEVASRDHVDGAVEYPQRPPVGGPHAHVWQNCGVYRSPVPNETAVHSMEHGAVWLTYRPGLARNQVEELEDLADGRRYVLVSPFPGLPAPVVASAWGRQLSVSDAEDPRLDRFVRAFEQGPHAPEPGAPCVGGVGSPR